MILLELDDESAKALVAEIEKAGESATTMREERFFGDANLVTVILAHTETIVTILSGAVSIWSGLKVARASTDNRAITDITKMNAEEIRNFLGS